MTPNDQRVLAGIVVVLLVATYAKFVLGWSTKDTVVTLMREFKDLMSAKHTAGGINAAVLVGVFLMIASYMFFPKFEKILSISGAIPTSGSSGPSLLGATAIFCVGGLLCVSLVRSR